MDKNYPLLAKIDYPSDLKDKIGLSDLPQLCQEIRGFMIDSVSKTGGHLGAGLGVVELSLLRSIMFLILL